MNHIDVKKAALHTNIAASENTISNKKYTDMVTDEQYDFVDSFSMAIVNAGLTCPNQVMVDGKYHRFHIDGDKPGSKNGWYRLFAEPLPMGAFGCWKRDIRQNWCSKNYNELTQEERDNFNERLKEIQKKQRKEQEIQHSKAQLRSKSIWQAAGEVNTHPYLERKKIKAYGIKITKSVLNDDNLLVIPIKDSQENIYSLQYINSAGEKWFVDGGLISSNYYTIGNTTDKFYICEGYATGASIYEVTNSSVIIAFNAGNLLLVAQAIRKKHPDSEIIIAADNDQWNKDNVGLEKAKKAAETVGGKLAVPDFNRIDNSSKPTDFNDLMCIAGTDEVKIQLSKAESVSTPIFNDELNNIKPSQSTMLLALVSNVDFFHDNQKQSYATFSNNGHNETWLLDSRSFKDWLSGRFWTTYKKAPNKQAISDALGVMHAKAFFEGACQKIYTRIGILNEKIYINLANENWEAIEISESGWEIIENPPVKFRGIQTMLPLPIPNKEGDINLLWKYCNIPEYARKLVIAWLLDCLRPDTHFPILVLTGLQGSAKSSTQNILRQLIDPSSSNLRAAPRKPEDILVAAANNWLVSFNNLSHLSAQNQDDLCCLATGGGLGTRKLFTTCEEYVVDIKRPIILNGITEIVTAPDLVDRSIMIDLPSISPKNRKTDKEINEAFIKDYPLILGALLNIFSKVLAVLPSITLDHKPRMADFALLGVALEKILNWQKGDFIKDYQYNRDENLKLVLESSPIINALLKYLKNNQNTFDGTFNDLYEKLDSYRNSLFGWPSSAKGLANILKRQIPALAAIDVEVIFDNRRRKNGYHLTIHKKDEIHLHHVQHIHEFNEDIDFKSIITTNEDDSF